MPLPYRFQKPSPDDEEDGVELAKPGSSRLSMLRRESAKAAPTVDSDSESDDEVEQAMRPPPSATPDGAAAPTRGGSRRGLLKRLHGRLVPDAGGERSLGPQLADQAAAHGAVARDYQPRSLEPDGGLDSSDEEARSRPSDI